MTFPAVAAASARFAASSFGSSTDTVPLPRLTRKLGRAGAAWGERGGRERQVSEEAKRAPTIDRSRLEKLSRERDERDVPSRSPSGYACGPRRWVRARAREARTFSRRPWRDAVVATNASAFVRTSKVKHAWIRSDAVRSDLSLALRSTRVTGAASSVRFSKSCFNLR